MKKGAKIILIVIILLIVILFLIRLISPTQMDDVSPEINCPEIEKYKPDTLYIIPNFNSNPISNNSEWCEYILSLNKTLGLHGINHQPYRELLYENISQERLEFAIITFENCFNQTPRTFKSPQLKINKGNKELVKENDLILKNKFSQATHKVYHCSDGGKIKNKWIKVF